MFPPGSGPDRRAAVITDLRDAQRTGVSKRVPVRMAGSQSRPLSLGLTSTACRLIARKNTAPLPGTPEPRYEVETFSGRSMKKGEFRKAIPQDLPSSVPPFNSPVFIGYGKL